MRSEPIAAQLPDAFTAQLRVLLGEDLDAFRASLDEPRTRGLRVNPAKIGPAELEALLGIELSPVPWCRTGFALPPGESLGGHPAHLAGLFYLQEPSAMCVAEALAPQPGWSVIDLAAAPGGKATHLSALVGRTGLVVANDVAGHRLRALHDNLDRWGAANVVTASVALDRLAGTGAQFDAAVLDAPCSGEALFRRDPRAIRHWSLAAVAGAARRQRELLHHAAALVRPGGVLVYSTCTFNLAENEEQVADLLAACGGWTLEDCTTLPAVSPGHHLDRAPTERAARLWPHRATGEGQFVARLRRGTSAAPRRPGAVGRSRRARDPRSGSGGRRPERARAGGPASAEVREAWKRFQGVALDPAAAPHDDLAVRGDRIYAVPALPPPVDTAPLARPGLPLGRLRPGRFEPHPGLAASLRGHQVADAVDWDEGRPELAAYVRGETVQDAGADGWVLVCYRGHGLGWARRSGGVLKNFLPPRQRIGDRPAGSGGSGRRR
jgi:16S rRNA C967 or C1407 C5-methylase (RsmB/RsmF family)/NOL1/NOP2/fmu family ribosome biogenesis protein